MKRLVRHIYHSLFRAALFVRCWCSDRWRFRGQDGAPIPPALLRYRVSESLSTAQFLTIGKACADHIENHVHAMGGQLSTAQRILDFGCGCGRTLRWFVAKHPGVQFHGIDVDADAIGWCTENIATARFCKTGPQPPSPYPEQYFDVVYCLSVFTHLDEQLQDLWLPELRRILRPTGILVMTVHGERVTSALDADGVESLRRTGFVHRTTTKLNGIAPEWYNTTWHSQHYIVARLGRLFGDVRYVAVPEGMQDFVVAKLPRSGAS